jgi:hypothetical protein
MKNNNNGDRNIWENRRRYHMRKKNRNDRNIRKNTTGTSVIIDDRNIVKNRRQEHMGKTRQEHMENNNNGDRNT